MSFQRAPLRRKPLTPSPPVKTLSRPDNDSGVLKSGKPLDASVRSSMEQRLGHDFSRVRVHADGAAAGSADALAARAYTMGHNIVFGASEYAPATARGQQLLAHELAHVVQQRSSSSDAQTIEEPTSAAEREADQVSAQVVAGQQAVPQARANGMVHRQPKPGKGAPAGGSSWTQQVEAAKGEQDETKKATALAALVKQALGTTMTVNQVPLGTTLDPAQLKPSPTVNFDLNLNQKQSWPATKGAKTRRLSTNYGYSFSKGADRYIILGPNAVDPRSPLFVEMSAKHELFHVAHHLGAKQTRSDADEELEAWTNDFTSYFERLFQFRQQWSPLIGYYEDATSGAQQTALAAILAFYQGASADTQAAVDRWLKRRQADSAHASKALIKDLAAKLPAPKGKPAKSTP
jgi:Zn-dependent peptidase ImmA (M78 family)